VSLAKPDPAIYRKACAALEVAPSACAFVADGAGGELEAAGALGLFTVKIRRPNQHAPEDFAVRADRRVESLEEVPGLL
jgi:FMN phosphatase YigB (HAD superfamily)